ncbi:MAG: matrixin family metalloprotease [Cyanobacteria bacterium J06627_28]
MNFFHNSLFNFFNPTFFNPLTHLSRKTVDDAFNRFSQQAASRQQDYAQLVADRLASLNVDVEASTVKAVVSGLQSGSAGRTRQLSLLSVVVPRLLSAVDQYLAAQAVPGRYFSNRYDRAIAQGIADAFVTVLPTGEPVQGGGNPNELKWTATSLDANGQTVTTVSFAFHPDFGFSTIAADRAKTLFVIALQTWAAHAPIVFQEIAYPGSIEGVDILATADKIDGEKGKLAVAYYPGPSAIAGDITFDTAENWTESRFLETSVHELGHTLGLGHEDGEEDGEKIDAILNSEFKNHFKDTLDAFLHKDDIDGIQYLYGKGVGAVKLLDGTTVPLPEAKPAPVVAEPPKNLVVNGSFEEVSVAEGEYGLYSAIAGWKLIGANSKGFQVDRRGDAFGAPSDGTAWVELDTLGQNNTFGQNIDTVTGQNYTLSVDFTKGGRKPDTTRVQVFWEGQLIDTITGGGRGKWRTVEHEVTGGERSVSTLAFRSVGEADYIGGFIDNISVVAKPTAQALTDSALGSSALGSSERGAADGLAYDDLTTHLIKWETMLPALPVSSEGI